MLSFLCRKLLTPQAVERGEFTSNRSFSEIKSISESENDLENETKIEFLFERNRFSFILMSKYQKVDFDMTEDYLIIFCQQKKKFELNFRNGYSRLGTFTVTTAKE